MSVRRLVLAGAQVEIHHDAETASLAAADRIAEAVRAAIEARGRAILGLATGSTPEATYARLVALHRAGELSFARVSTYNLDEYYPISPLDPNSYRAFMHRHLFGLVDLDANRAHVLDGTVPEPFVAEHATQFERWMAEEGGLDLQLLGIGRNAHIGFNEPTRLPLDDALKLPTRLIELAPETRALYAADFGGERRVPARALTVGVAPILAARSILILAFGPAKAEPVARSLLGPITPEVPGSLLQTIPGKVLWILDEAAARSLKSC